MIKRILRVLAASLMLFACLLASPVTAQAAPFEPTANTAYNTRDQYLTCCPTGANHPSEVERRIYLAAGQYDLFQIMAEEQAKAADNYYLGAGNYTWTDVLIPTDQFNYRHVTYLDPDNPDWGTARFEIPNARWELSGSGTRTWGSALDPQF